MVFRFLFCVFTLFTCFAVLAQPAFERPVWSENFDHVNEDWRQSNNADELFLIQNGAYLLWRKNKTSPSIILPERDDKYGEAKTETAVTIDGELVRGSAGLVCLAEKENNTTLVFEINGRGEFRVRQLKNNLFVPLSGKEKNSGWEKDKSINKAGERNVLAIYVVGSQVAFFANGTKLFEHTDKHVTGKSGLYIGEASKAVFEYLNVFVSEEEAERIKKERDAGDPVKAALTDVIVQLRNTINRQNHELDSLDKELKKRVLAVEKLDNSPKNVKKLSQEIAALKKENASLEWKVKKLEKENNKLADFQAGIKKSQSGDIVINLSNLLASEKEEKERLQKENAELKKKITEYEKKFKQEE